MKNTSFEIKDFIKTKVLLPQIKGQQLVVVYFLSLGNKASFSFRLNLYSLGEQGKIFTFLFGPCMRPCKQLFFIHKCSRHLLFCLFSICFLLLLAKEPLFPVGSPLHGVWVGWLCFSTGLESSPCLANQRTPTPMWLAGMWPSPLWGFSAGAFGEAFWVAKPEEGGLGRPVPCCAPTMSEPATEGKNEQGLNAALQSVGPDWPEALALMNFPIILITIV